MVFTLKNISLICAGGALLLSSMAGCGKPSTVITGVVTFDGRPVPEAVMEFFPTAGDAPTTGAFTNEAGRYRAKVSPTKYTVSIAASRVTGTRKMDDPAMPDVTTVEVREQYLPSRYTRQHTTPLTVTAIADQTTTFDFPLEGRPAVAAPLPP